jgi:micrococcal nuclease
MSVSGVVLMKRGLVVLVSGLLALLSNVATPGMRTAEATHPTCTVARVIDGDTFDCTDGTRVRMLQIDALELDQCGGAWAKAALEWLFLPPGRTVRLEYDVVTTDRYGRHLAAPIWRGNDGYDYNLSIVMVYVGLAKAAYYGDNAKFLSWAQAAEAWARAAQWNMWAPNGPYVVGEAACGASTPPPPGNRCDPAYPDVCIAPPPPDLDCKDIPYRRFRVLPPDPHRFDADGDGIGCESG